MSVGTEENGVGERVFNALWRAAMIVSVRYAMLFLGYQCSQAMEVRYY